MCLQVDFFEFLDRYPGINLGGFQFGMTQHLLDITDITIFSTSAKDNTFRIPDHQFTPSFQPDICTELFAACAILFAY
jgi:hypothetical protein